MKIIIFGTGNYVTGRGTNQYGTILPAVFEFSKTNKVEEIIVVATCKKSKNKAKQKIEKIINLSKQKNKIKIILNKNINNFLKKYNKDNSALKCSIIATPDHTHYKIAKACLKNQFHCLIVKPSVTKLSELNSLIKIANKKKVYAAVEFHKRFDRQAKILKEKYTDGFIGDTLYTWTEYSQKKIVPENFFKSWVSKNNVFQYLGIHYIDLIRYITRSIPVSVMAVGQKNYLYKKKLKTEDSIQVIVKWKNLKGKYFSQTLLLNWIDPKNTSAMSDQNLNFVGTLGRIELDQKIRGVKSIGEKSVLEDINPDFCRMYKNEDGSTEWEGYGIDSIQTFLEDITDLTNKKIDKKKLIKIRPSLEESKYSTAVLEAANYSLKNKSVWKKIKIK